MKALACSDGRQGRVRGYPTLDLSHVCAISSAPTGVDFNDILSSLRGYVGRAVRVHGSALLSFVGATLAVGGFIASTLTDKPVSTRWNILSGFGALVAATGALISSMQQTKGEEEIKNKNMEIISLQRHIFDTLTGGKAYCYLRVMPDTDFRATIYICYAAHETSLRCPNSLCRRFFCLGIWRTRSRKFIQIGEKRCVLQRDRNARYDKAIQLDGVSPYGFSICAHLISQFAAFRRQCTILCQKWTMASKHHISTWRRR